MNELKQKCGNPASVTFVATSNKVSSTESKVSLGKDVCIVIARSGAFETAFKLQDQGEAFSTAFEPQTQGCTTAPTFIQSSASNAQLGEARHGLVSSILEAYNHHHNLILRPDDVWQAILTQFSFYVNARSEDLRDYFVDFQEKKTLVVEMPPGTLFSTDFGNFANRMVEEQIAKNVKDPDTVDWLLPKFSTTTMGDRIAASVTMMSTLQAYFNFVCMMCCGIPEVTLEGTPADWRLLRRKIDRLPLFDVKGKDPVMEKWLSLLVPVLDHFVSSADGSPDLSFWDTVCSRIGGGSGPSYLSGWVTVFACFKCNGSWQGDIISDTPYGQCGSQLAKWPVVETSDIPAGAVSVSVVIDDNGTQYDTHMLAGQFAFEIVASRHDANKFDTIRPRTDWCIAYQGEP